jgi:hypothetical protein
MSAGPHVPDTIDVRGLADNIRALVRHHKVPHWVAVAAATLAAAELARETTFEGTADVLAAIAASTWRQMHTSKTPLVDQLAADFGEHDPRLTEIEREHASMPDHATVPPQHSSSAVGWRLKTSPASPVGAFGHSGRRRITHARVVSGAWRDLTTTARLPRHPSREPPIGVDHVAARYVRPCQLDTLRERAPRTVSRLRVHHQLRTLRP